MTQNKIVEPRAKTFDEMRKELKRNYKKNENIYNNLISCYIWPLKVKVKGKGHPITGHEGPEGSR
jgi:hypothetical protein